MRVTASMICVAFFVWLLIASPFAAVRPLAFALVPILRLLLQVLARLRPVALEVESFPIAAPHVNRVSRQDLCRSSALLSARRLTSVRRPGLHIACAFVLLRAKHAG